jgi:hypothetical protein
MPVADNKPTVFIGSSRAAMPYANRVRRGLARSTKAKVWSSAFQPGQWTLQVILDHASRSDFGVFVLAPDDAAVIKGTRQSTVRDNVLFESGVFMGKLGPRRTFLLWPAEVAEGLRLPSDLEGLTLVTYDPKNLDQAHIAVMRNAIRAMGPALKSGYDEIAGLQRQLETRIVDLDDDPSESLMQILGPIAARRGWSSKTSVKTLMTTVEKSYHDDIVDEVFWWLVVYGVVTFKGIERWSEGDWHWSDSMPHAMFTERGVVLLNHLRSLKRGSVEV